MDHESNRAGCADARCPLCAFWSAYKQSDIAKHVQGVQRESLLLLRSVLDASIRCAEDACSARRPVEKEDLRA